MDYEEKTVLKRKRLAIGLQVNLTARYLREFRESGVQTDRITALIQKRLPKTSKRPKAAKRTESFMFQKMMKFLELLPQYSNDKTFPLLVSLLEQDYYWLGEELKADLLAEKDQLNIDDYIQHLAESLVNDKYGTTLRLTAKDRLSIVNLVAKRIQCAKESCRERLAIAQEQLTQCRARATLIDEEMHHLLMELIQQRKLHEQKSTSLCLIHNPKSPQEKATDTAAVENSGEKDVETELQVEFHAFLALIDKVIGEEKFLQESKLKALKVLEAPKADADLNDELMKIWKKLQDQKKAKETWAENKMDKCSSLRQELHAIYRQIREVQTEKEKEMLEITNYLEKANEMQRFILDDIELLRKEYKFCQEKIGQYKARLMKIERTRHLGYLGMSAPDRANLGEVLKDKARAKAPIKKPRVIQATSHGISHSK